MININNIICINIILIYIVLRIYIKIKHTFYNKFYILLYSICIIYIICI